MWPLLLPSALAAAPEVAGPTAPRWTVSVDPLTVALGFTHVQVERALAPAWSLYAGPSVHVFDSPLLPEPEPYLGLGVEAGVRWVPWAKAPTGPWVMGRGVGAWIHTTDGSDEAAIGGYGSGLLGYTGIVAGWLVLSGGLGVNILHYRVGSYGVAGVLPAAHTAIGVAW